MTEEVSKEQIKGVIGTGIDEAKRLKEKKGANMVVKILAIVLVIFGAGKLPKVMGDLGKGVNSFKKGLNEKDEAPKALSDKTE